MFYFHQLLMQMIFFVNIHSLSLVGMFYNGYKKVTVDEIKSSILYTSLLHLEIFKVLFLISMEHHIH